MTPSELTRLLELHRRFVTGLREGARANLSSKNLAGANLANCNLQQLIAPGANFTKCSLVATDFSFADCTETNFYRADLRGAHLQGARLVMVNLEECDLRPASM